MIMELLTDEGSLQFYHPGHCCLEVEIFTVLHCAILVFFCVYLKFLIIKRLRRGKTNEGEELETESLYNIEQFTRSQIVTRP